MIDVYFEDEIEILVEDLEGYSLEGFKGVLDSNEIEYTRIINSAKS